MKKLEKILDVAMSTVMSAVMLVLVIFGTWQIFTRWILNNPSTFTEEMLRYLLIWAGMIGAAYCFFHDKHIKLTLLTSRLKGKALTVVTIIDEIVVLAFVVYVYIYGGAQMVIQNGTQLTAVMRLPMSIIYACLPVSGVFVILSKVLRYAGMMQASKNKKGESES